ncbi:hypothetical protein B0O99DRAFT_683734 [Bisporella sp. PMI_857]|nr:hypothetical protein B0O99DRAFT_683734 [Bisporella sp. PMI_857]
MAGYDNGSTMTTVHSGFAPNLRLTALEAGSSLSQHIPPTMDAFEHELNFDQESFVDDINNGLAIPYTPSYDLSTFEDPFSYQSGPFESLLDDTSTAQNVEPASTAELDNKLLGFGAAIPKAAVLDQNGQTWPSMTAELYGMFFVAEDVFGGETTGRPLELTCYRRNLFQISGTVTMSRSCSHILSEQGQRIPIYEMSATISALESIEGKSTEIISVPWKTSTLTSSEEKAGQAPPKWPLDLSMNPELDPQMVQIPIAWKRLQFKHATANNGRRKGLQQHYIVQINLVATLATGESVKIAEIQSGPIIVRGRSPRNFDSRKDVPLNERKIENKPRTTSETTTPVKPEPSGGRHNSFGFYSLTTVQPDTSDWDKSQPPLLSPSVPTTQHTSKKLTLSRPPPVPKWKQENTASKPSQAPIDLSLVDDEALTRARKGLTSESPETVGVAKKVGSPVENGDADLLYEYFPLSVDDWMPPVDAIYRPHVVHHMRIPPDLQAQQGKSKTKRYFSADD